MSRSGGRAGGLLAGQGCVAFQAGSPEAGGSARDPEQRPKAGETVTSPEILSLQIRSGLAFLCHLLLLQNMGVIFIESSKEKSPWLSPSDTGPCAWLCRATGCSSKAGASSMTTSPSTPTSTWKTDSSSGFTQQAFREARLSGRPDPWREWEAGTLAQNDCAGFL